MVVGETHWWGDLVAWMGGMEEGMKEGGASEWVRNQDALHGVGRGPWCHGNTAIDRRDMWGPLVGHPTSVHTRGGRGRIGAASEMGTGHGATLDGLGAVGRGWGQSSVGKWHAEGGWHLPWAGGI